MNWRGVGVKALSLLTVLAGFFYGCVVVGFITAVWATKVAPHDGQNGLAVLIFGFMGGIASAVVTLFFVIWIHHVVRRHEAEGT